MPRSLAQAIIVPSGVSMRFRFTTWCCFECVGDTPKIVLKLSEKPLRLSNPLSYATSNILSPCCNFLNAELMRSIR